MGFASENNGMYMPVAPAYGGGYGGGYGGDCFGGGGLFWLLVLFLFGFAGNGWGNGFGGGQAAPMMYNDVQRGFDQQAVVTGINGIQSSMSAGFAAAESSAAARQMAGMQQNFAMQTAIDQRLDSLAMALQQSACENRAAIADVKYSISQDGALTRQTFNDGKQQIMDELCQMKFDNMKTNYENRIAAMQNQIDDLRLQNGNARFDASQNSQTATIQAGQRNLASEIEQYVLPTPRPAWIVQNPSCCNQNFMYGGCSGVAA